MYFFYSISIWRKSLSETVSNSCKNVYVYGESTQSENGMYIEIRFEEVVIANAQDK